MTSRIVHFYFLRFGHIIRQFRHFVFRIGSYETDKAYSSAISLRVAAKTRTKPTGAPPIVKRTNMTLTMAVRRDDAGAESVLTSYHGHGIYTVYITSR